MTDRRSVLFTNEAMLIEGRKSGTERVGLRHQNGSGPISNDLKESSMTAESTEMVQIIESGAEISKEPLEVCGLSRSKNLPRF